MQSEWQSVPFPTRSPTNDIPWKSPPEIFPIFHLIEYRHNTQILLLPCDDGGGPFMNISSGDEKSPFLLRHCQFLVPIKMQYLV